MASQFGQMGMGANDDLKVSTLFHVAARPFGCWSTTVTDIFSWGSVRARSTLCTSPTWLACSPTSELSRTPRRPSGSHPTSVRLARRLLISAAQSTIEVGRDEMVALSTMLLTRLCRLSFPSCRRL